MAVTLILCAICLMTYVIRTSKHKQRRWYKAKIGRHPLNKHRKNISLPKQLKHKDHRESTCEPRTRIFYLKVHKTGSSTFTHILKRFGSKNNLNCVIPANNESAFSTFGTLSRAVMDITRPNEPPDLLFHHVTYNREVFKTLLPHDMVYIASVREPISWFMSAFLFYAYDRHIAHIIGMKKSKIEERPLAFYVQIYLSAPERYETCCPILRALHRLPLDFGIPNEKFRDVSFIQNYTTTTLNKDFKIVLVAEHYDESLILFKRRMCWHVKDMFYLSKHVSTKSKPLSLRDEQVNEIRRQTPGLFIIYDHFLERHKREVASQGAEFLLEVDEFKRLSGKVHRFCLTEPSLSTRISLNSFFSGKFSISGKLCRQLDSPAMFKRKSHEKSTIKPITVGLSSIELSTLTSKEME